MSTIVYEQPFDAHASAEHIDAVGAWLAEQGLVARQIPARDFLVIEDADGLHAVYREYAEHPQRGGRFFDHSNCLVDDPDPHTGCTFAKSDWKIKTVTSPPPPFIALIEEASA